jgi:hypothetical protein
LPSDSYHRRVWRRFPAGVKIAASALNRDCAPVLWVFPER